MSITEASRLIGVGADADFTEIKRQYRRLAKFYHPDIPETGDARRFALIATAYLLLQSKALGIDKIKDIPVEQADAIEIRTEIERYFAELLQDFREFRKQLHQNTLSYTHQTIMACNSARDLRQVLDESVARHLVEIGSHL